MKSKEKRTTVGVLINNLDMEYQREIWNGVEAAAARLDVDVVFFEVGVVNSMAAKETDRYRIYDYISSRNIDGLILISTVFANFIERFGHLLDVVPVVNIGPMLPGVFSAWVDNADGIAAVTEHLITVHGKRKLLFMGASDNHLDGVERKNSFLATLRKHGLEPLEDGLLSGTFAYGTARGVLSLWLEKRIEFDAVVAANDDMAFGCYDELVGRGFMVPDEIAITGFDDVPTSRYFEVPLTTVHQPIFEIGSLALETLIGKIEGVKTGNSIVLPAGAVIRQSCGCFSRETAAAGELLSGGAVSPSGRLPSGVVELETAFFDGLTLGTPGTGFLNAFRTALHARNGRTADIVAWENFVTLLRNRLLGRNVPRDVLTAGETLLHQARVMLLELGETAQASERLKLSQRNREVQYAFISIIGSFGVSNLMHALRESLPGIGVRSCFLSLFVPGTSGNRSRLHLGFSDGVDIVPPRHEIEFDTIELFPRNLLPLGRRFNFLAKLLFHRSEVFGMIVMEIDPGDGVFSAALTSQIRSALNASLLMDELVEKDVRLNNAFDQLSARADELERANGLIRRNQDQLLMSERMASLGRLTAGIAHEMNTPLAAVRASMAELSGLVGEYGASIGDPEITPDDHRAIVGDMEKTLELAVKAGERAAAFIRGIKTQTRDNDRDAEGVPFDAADTVRETLILLAHALRRGNCTVDLSAPARPLTVAGKPGKLSQVLTNLVTNAVDAMAPGGGIVRISLSEDSQRVIISVSDSGCGISPDNLKKIFEPLFTTKPFGLGTGLGLTIVHDIVYGEFGGSISVESRPGKGSTFTVDIPRISGT